jgi:predicted methyltransferase
MKPASLLVFGVLLVLMLAATWIDAQPRRRQQSHGRLFPPEDLGLLEAPDRDIWQQPEQIMDVLGIADGAVVADIGAGAGWFTIHLSRRVGPQGTVYAEDVQPEMISAIARRANALRLTNVKPILGVAGDPRLPAGRLDAILMVDAYHEMSERVPMLRHLATALKPGGRLGIVDFKLEGSGPGPDVEERVAPEVVIAEARQAGLQVASQETFLPYQYFLIFRRP